MFRLSAPYRLGILASTTAIVSVAIAAKALVAESAGAATTAIATTAPVRREVPDWTTLADLALASPVILRGTVHRARRLSGKAAADVPAGHARLLLEVDLAQVVKAPGVLPARAEWLWQGPLGADGRPPVRAGADLLAFLTAPTAGQRPEVAQFQLVSGFGQRPWQTADDAAVRAILAEAQRHGAPMVTGVSDAFFTESDVEGASESQFFLRTDAGKPLTLIVTRRPNATPQVRAATGDMIAASAAAVVPGTLVWRALACGLPELLPLPLRSDPGLVADYRLARDRLGTCGTRAFTGWKG